MERQGSAAPPASRCGNRVTSAAMAPTARPVTSKTFVSCKDDLADEAAAETNGLHHGKLAAALDDVVKLHGH